MRKFAIVCAIGCTLMSLNLLVSSISGALIDEDVKKALDKIAGHAAKGEDAAAQKEAAALAKKIEELNDVMHGFKPRNVKKGVKGLGVGSKPGVVIPDGIEQKLIVIGRDGITAGDLKKEGAAIGEAAWHIAAIAEVTIARAPEKDTPTKKKADWLKWSQEMRSGAKDLATAIKGGSAADVKTAATKLNNSCNSCHMVFRK